MPNLRIVTKNALRQAASLTASSTAGNLAVSSLAAAVKSSLHRFTSTNGSYRATWAAPARIGCVALPFCNWSPTAKQRVRVSKERSATNLFSNSEKFDSASWNKSLGLYAQTGEIAPDGSLSACRIISAGGSPVITQSVRATASSMTLSFYTKKGSRSTAQFFLRNGTTSTNLTTGSFNYDTNAITGTGWSATNVGGGWYRLSFTSTTHSVGDLLTAYLGSNGGTLIPAGDSWLLWGAMLNEGGLSSYYPSQETFTSRASVGTYVDSNGLIKSAAANTPRMHYDPMTPFASPRLLLEAAATNYCKGSQLLSGAGWFGAVGTPVEGISYRGVPYQRITKTASFGYLAAATFTAVAGQVYTSTFAIRAGTTGICDFGLYDDTATTFGAVQDVQAGILSGPGALSGSLNRPTVTGLSAIEDTLVQITRLYRVGTTSARLYFYPGGSTSVVGDSVLATRVQVEEANAIYGPELVTNGTFDTGIEEWTLVLANATADSGKLRLANTGPAGRAYTTVPTVIGRSYLFSATSTGTSNAQYWLTASNSPDGSQAYATSPMATQGTAYLSFVATGTLTRISLRNENATAVHSWDNVSVKEFTLVPVVTSYIPTTTAAATRAADVYTSAPGVRPDGCIDHWQSYDYDSGWVLACPAPAVELEGFTPAQAASAYAYGGGAYARHWLPQQMDATGLAVDIADPDNLQGYIEAACMVAGPVWSPRYNASGTSVSVIDRTEVSRSAAGDQLADPGTLSRKVPVDLRAMPEEDRARFLDLVRNSRAHPILMSVFPEHPDLALERDFMVYGRRTKDSDIAYQFAGAYSTTLEIEEI